VPNGCICIYAQTLDGQVEVRIKNNGPPIPPQRIPHIFDRFSRAQSDNGLSGPGLGLSIASELTKAHSGSLNLIRSDSAWTEFRLRLPRKLIEQ
jgi:signal transduction histidine kinase